MESREYCRLEPRKYLSPVTEVSSGTNQLLRNTCEIHVHLNLNSRATSRRIHFNDINCDADYFDKVSIFSIKAR